MSELAALSVKLTADADGLKKALSDSRKEIASTAIEVGKLDSRLSKDLTRGTAQAGAALTDINRVVQDLPFGFAAIGNNLTQLPESFRRLKQETGSSGAAFKALLSSISGAGGIGFALSALTTAITFASLGFGAWTRGLTGNKQALDENAKSAKKLADEYSSIVGSISKEVSQVEILVESFKKENLTRKEKANIIEQLQKISPAYFANLDKEKTTVEQVTLAYENYSRSILRAIELKVREADLEKVIKRRLELQDQGAKKTIIEVDANGKLKKSINAVWDADATGRKASFNDLVLTQDQQRELNNLLITEKELIKDIANLKITQDFTKVDKVDKVKKDKKTISDVLQELSKEMDFLNTKEIVLKEDQTNDKISSILSTADRLIKDFNVNPDDTLLAKLLGTSLLGGQQGLPINIPGVEGLKNRYIKDLEPVLSKPGENLTIKVPINIETVYPALSKVAKQIEVDLSSVFQSVATNVAVSFGETLGNALSGGVDLGDFFKSIFAQLGSGLKQLGQYLIQAATEYLIAKETFTSNPYLAIAAGVALTAIGTALQNSLSKKKAFAVGGLVPGTGNRDSVDALLMPGEFVVRKSAVQAIGLPNLQAINKGYLPTALTPINSSGHGGATELFARISGSDIYLSNQRETARRGRQG